jgi:hypothetical protein
MTFTYYTGSLPICYLLMDSFLCLIDLLKECLDSSPSFLQALDLIRGKNFLVLMDSCLEGHVSNFDGRLPWNL